MATTTVEENSITWKCKHTWKRASINTLWCLLGCSIGDFGTIYFFQVTGNPWEFSVVLIMSLAIMNGLITSIMLETFILSRQMILKEAFKVAIGMSLYFNDCNGTCYEHNRCIVNRWCNAHLVGHSIYAFGRFHYTASL